MKKDRTIELLDSTIMLLKEQLNEAALREKQLHILISNLNQKITDLTSTIESLQNALLDKNKDLGKKGAQIKGLSKILSNKSEKQADVSSETTKAQKAPTPKERGNNGAKRKEHHNLETIITDCYPSIQGFNPDLSKSFNYQDVIRYEYKPARFIKHIYRVHCYRINDSLIKGEAPAAPIFNSNYDGSFIAGIAQLRYVYSMSVERIVKFFNESGFELEKPTAHGLLKKASDILENLYKASLMAVLESPYISGDESYHTVLMDKGSRKGYIWGILSQTTRLIHFFFDNGSRSAEVLHKRIANYKGTIQSDAYSPYKALESEKFPDIKRIACFQHVKRKFIDANEDPKAQCIVDLINKIYQAEHKHKIGIDGWTIEKNYTYRQQYYPPIMTEIKKELLDIKNSTGYIKSSDLGKAVEHMLTEWNALVNIFSGGAYSLDNNRIEQCNRYISLSRRNSLFFGSNKGAERGALFYTLAVSCRNNNINFLEYLTDVLNKAGSLPPNTKIEVYRDMLPDKWKKEAKVE
ncbi:MAG: IS66 family transposase [Bacteroidales bacterium]